MKKISWILACVSFVLAMLSQAWAQPRVDSLLNLLPAAKEDTNKVKLLNELARFQLVNPDEARSYGEEALELSRKLGFKKGEATAHFNIATTYKNTGRLPQAVEHLLLALRIDEEIGYKKGIGAVWSTLGNVYNQIGDLTKAEEAYTKALAISEEVKNDENIGANLSNLGMVQQQKGNNDAALAYFERALLYIEKDGLVENAATTRINMGKAYAGKGDFGSALKLYYDAFAIYQQLHSPKGVGYAVFAITEAYLDLAEIPSASLPDSLKNIQRLLGRAEQLVRNTIDRAELQNAIDDLYYNYYMLTNVLQKQGRFSEALEALRWQFLYRDSLLNLENRERIAALTQQREAEIAQKQIELQQLRIAKAEQERWFFGVGVLLLLLFGTALFHRFRAQQRARRLLEVERIRSRISRDLHDDIGSTLSSINMLAHAARKRLNDNDVSKTTEQLERIGERTQRMLSGMRDIVWNIKPDNDTLPAVLSRMREYAAGILDAKGISYSIDFPESTNAALPLELKHNLYLVFKEAVNNLAKHSGCTEAAITLTFENKKLRMTVRDNGCGFLDGGNDGNGLSNIRQRAAEAGAALSVESNIGGGTAVTFEADITQTWYNAAAARV